MADEEKRDLSHTIHIDLGSKLGASPLSETRRVSFSSPPPDAAELKEYTLLDNVYDAALVTTLDGIVVTANVRATEFLGFPPEEFRRLRLSRVVAGVTPELMLSLRDHLEHDRFALIQGYCLRKNGTTFPAEIAATLLSRERSRLCFFIRDITRRKQTEDLIRTGHLAMRNAANGIAVIDRTARILFANPAFARLWGFASDDDAAGRNFADLVVETDLVLRMLRDVLTLQREWRAEMQARTVPGDLTPIQVIVSCNRDSEGAVAGAVLSVIDLREAKRAEQAIRESEQRQAMLASIGAACHHLAQPATVILGILHTLADERLDAAERGRLLEDALAAAKNLADLIHRLNRVERFRTTPYLAGSTADAPGQRLLEI